MTAFEQVNWLATGVTSVVLVAALWRERHLLLKPSIVVLLVFHVRIQWAAAIQSSTIEAYLPAPWDFALLAQGFPVLGLLLALGTWREESRAVWRRVTSPPVVASGRRLTMMLVLSVGILSVVGLFLSIMPWRSTGLYAILFDPASAADARAAFSLGGLSRSPLRYSYHVMANVLAPLLAAMIAMDWAALRRRREIARGAIGLATVALLVVVVSFSGARSYSAMIVLTVLWTVYLQRGLPVNPVGLLIGGVAVLALPTVLSVLREGLTVDLVVLWDHLVHGIFNRVFVAPMETGLWHVHFAQTQAPVGWAGIPKIAALLDRPAVNMPNLIAAQYAPGGGGETGGANTSFVFSYYSYFGQASFPLSLVGLWALDAVFVVYRRLSDHLLLPCVVATSVASTSLVNAEYTVVLVTNGLAVAPVVALVLESLVPGGGGRVAAARASPWSPGRRATARGGT